MHNNHHSVGMATATGTFLGTAGFSMGGMYQEAEQDDVDFKYLEDVIQRVKEQCEGQYQLSDYIEAAMIEYNIQQAEEWDAIVAESKEGQKTLKKIVDIAGMPPHFE